MLELYHNINSVCAQKVRIALKEKGQEAKEHLLKLRGDQNDPAYMKLNPNGVVPTLVHDEKAIIESSLILYYIDDVFPEPPLMPKEPLLRFRVRMYNKLIDEYLHNACTILTFATAFRPNFLKVPREIWLAEINKAPLKRRAEYKRSVIEHGLDSEFVVDAVAQHQKLLSWMAHSLKSAASPMPIARSSPTSCGSNCSSLTICGRHIPASPTGGRGCARGHQSRPRSSIA